MEPKSPKSNVLRRGIVKRRVCCVCRALEYCAEEVNEYIGVAKNIDWLARPEATGSQLIKIRVAAGTKGVCYNASEFVRHSGKGHSCGKVMSGKSSNRHRGREVQDPTAMMINWGRQRNRTSWKVFPISRRTYILGRRSAYLPSRKNPTRDVSRRPRPAAYIPPVPSNSITQSLEVMQTFSLTLVQELALV